MHHCKVGLRATRYLAIVRSSLSCSATRHLTLSPHTRFARLSPNEQATALQQYPHLRQTGSNRILHELAVGRFPGCSFGRKTPDLSATSRNQRIPRIRYRISAWFIVHHPYSCTLAPRRSITLKRTASRSARAARFTISGDAPMRPGASAIGVSTAVFTWSSVVAPVFSGAAGAVARLDFRRQCPVVGRRRPSDEQPDRQMPDRIRSLSEGCPA